MDKELVVRIKSTGKLMMYIISVLAWPAGRGAGFGSWHLKSTIDNITFTNSMGEDEYTSVACIYPKTPPNV